MHLKWPGVWFCIRLCRMFMACSHAENVNDCSRMSCWELFPGISSLIWDHLEGRAKQSRKWRIFGLCCPGKKISRFTLLYWSLLSGLCLKSHGIPLSRARQRVPSPWSRAEGATQGDCAAKPLNPVREGKMMTGRVLITAGRWDFLRCSTQVSSEISAPGSSPYPYFIWPLLLIYCG